jgi:hypothetical protein
MTRVADDCWRSRRRVGSGDNWAASATLGGCCQTCLIYVADGVLKDVQYLPLLLVLRAHFQFTILRI